VVRPVLNPEIDVELLAQTIIDHVLSLPQKERDRLAEDGRMLRERLEKEAA
jgi:hypothetical protein